MFAVHALNREKAGQALGTIVFIIKVSIAVADGLRATVVVVVLKSLQRLQYLILILRYYQVLQLIWLLIGWGCRALILVYIIRYSDRIRIVHCVFIRRRILSLILIVVLIGRNQLTLRNDLGEFNRFSLGGVSFNGGCFSVEMRHIRILIFILILIGINIVVIALLLDNMLISFLFMLLIASFHIYGPFKS